MEIDFNTDKLIVANYRTWCGGKFLVNSIGLSDGAYLQHQYFAKMQIKGKLTAQDKLDYLLQKIDETGDKWEDLDLGCAQMFGVFIEDQSQDAQYGKWIPKVTNSGRYFFIVTHEQEEYNQIKSIWPNSQDIQFIGCDEFMKEYRSTASRHDFHTVENPIYTWDARWYFDVDKTLSHMQELYALLGLNDFNEEYIRRYFVAWISKLDEMKNVYYR